jgi:hypothetical protein
MDGRYLKKHCTSRKQTGPVLLTLPSLVSGLMSKLTRFRASTDFIDHREIPVGSTFTFKVVKVWGYRFDGARLGIEITSGPFKGCLTKVFVRGWMDQ